MADRKDLLLLATNFELDFRRVEDADVLYKNYLFAHPFYDKFKLVMGSPSKALEEIEQAFQSDASHLSIALEFDTYLTHLEYLYHYYGVDKFRKATRDLTIRFANREMVARRYYKEGGGK